MNLFAWASRPEGRVFNNLTIADTAEGRKELAEITGEALMEAAAKAGARAAIFDSKSQWYAFHPTRVSEKYPDLGDRDLVAELIEAGKRREIVYVPYIPTDCDVRAVREHPQWRPRRADGSHFTETNGWPRFCQFAGRDWFCGYLKEIVSHYEIGGVWLDGIGMPGAPEFCYCDACRAEFQKRHGAEPPVSAENDAPELWALWRDFRGELIRENVAAYQRTIQAIKPGIPLNCGFGWHNWQNGGYANYFNECGTVWHEPSWMWQTASVQYMRAVGKRPPESYHPAFQYAPTHRWSMTRELLETKAMTCLANGGLPTFTLMGNLDTIRRVNDALAERADYAEGTENVPYAGLVFSHASMHRADPSPFAEPSTYTTYGALRLLQEEKIPEQYLGDADLEAGELDRFAVIVLPDIGYLSPKAQANLRGYVERGGGLLALHRTSLVGDLGEPLGNFGLSDLFGADFQGELEPQTTLPAWIGDLREGTEFPNVQRELFLTLEHAHPIEDDPRLHAAACLEVIPEYRRATPAGRRLAYSAPMLKVRTHAGAAALLREGLREPGTEFPLVTVNRFGKGRVVYIASNLTADYVDLCPHPYMRILFGNAVRWAAAGKPQPFEVLNAPFGLQVNVFAQPRENRTLVHFLNDPLPFGLPPFTKQTGTKWVNWVRMREDVIPVAGVTLRLPGQYRKIYSVPGNEPLPAAVKDGISEITVPPVGIHRIVVAEP